MGGAGGRGGGAGYKWGGEHVGQKKRGGVGCICMLGGAGCRVLAPHMSMILP